MIVERHSPPARPIHPTRIDATRIHLSQFEASGKVTPLGMITVEDSALATLVIAIIGRFNESLQQTGVLP